MDIDEYESKGRELYAAFAMTMTAILTAAISAENRYRLQQVRDRAKEPASLRKKLQSRNILESTTLEDDIKDLAGCRVVFYTNSDVARFVSSGIIHQNFEVIEAKIHHPQRTVDDAVGLYISNHYIVKLRPERVALPEYARFAEMRCEIQIQTILNHAWAEMAHDTIYKAPALGDFGGKAFEDIKGRMQKVAREYLLPAGYQFQKIANDFQRLIEGKALFDSDALKAIVEADDNNVRLEALANFTERVLPLYNDPQAEYREIVDQLIHAARSARTIEPIVIETPYGALPATTYHDISNAIAEVLTRFRYVDIDATFEALCTLYGYAENERERKPLLELGKALAAYHLDVWRKHGPVIQSMLIERIEALSDDKRFGLMSLLTEMLGKILGVEAESTSHNSTTMTLHRVSLIASEALRDVRAKAINLLKSQFALADSDKERSAILLSFEIATRFASDTDDNNALARLVLENTCTTLEFLREIASTQNLELLQMIEALVYRLYQKNSVLPETIHADPDLEAAREMVETASLAFRDLVNTNNEFVIYKTLVGYNSVFSPAWEEKEFNYAEKKAYRDEQVNDLLASVNDANADAWFDRICRFSKTESNDAATFVVFSKFLEQLAEAQPRIVCNYIDLLNVSLEKFLPSMLNGLMRSSEHVQALARIDAWLSTGVHIGDITWYLRFADPFNEVLLCRALNSAIATENVRAVVNVLTAAEMQFAAHPGTLVKSAFLPALSYLKSVGDFSWLRQPWFTWQKSSIIQALDKEQAEAMLDVLIPYPQLENEGECILAAIAERWPGSVINFMGERLNFAKTDVAPPRYEALPHYVAHLDSPLAAAPDILMDRARTWFNANSIHFKYGGGRLLASVFPDLSDGLEERLEALIASGEEQDLAFVLGVLSAFEGRPCVYKHVRAVVACLGTESELLKVAETVLDEGGVVDGEFGFAELYTDRKSILNEWLEDTNETVRRFAEEQVQELDRLIARENRDAVASIAMRKLEYDEELIARD